MVDYTELFTKIALGVVTIFTSLVGLVVWIIKRQAEQIEKLTDRFTTALEGTVNKNTEAHSHTAQTLLTVTNAVTELTTTVREMMSQNRDEHRALMDFTREGLKTTLEAIGKIRGGADRAA